MSKQKIDKKELRQIFKNFADTYQSSTVDVKRRLLNVVIDEIRCSVKKGKEKGEITYKLRGDGTRAKEWDEVRKQEDPKPPSSGGSSLQGAWLREQDSNP